MRRKKSQIPPEDYPGEKAKFLDEFIQGNGIVEIGPIHVIFSLRGREIVLRYREDGEVYRDASLDNAGRFTNKEFWWMQEWAKMLILANQKGLANLQLQKTLRKKEALTEAVFNMNSPHSIIVKGRFVRRKSDFSPQLPLFQKLVK